MAEREEEPSEVEIEEVVIEPAEEISEETEPEEISASDDDIHAAHHAATEARLEQLELSLVRINELERENAELRAELDSHHHGDEREEVAPPEAKEIEPIKPHPYRRLPRWV